VKNGVKAGHGDKFDLLLMLDVNHLVIRIFGDQFLVDHAVHKHLLILQVIMGKVTEQWIILLGFRSLPPFFMMTFVRRIITGVFI
jgi:hypothetical protein